MISWLKQAALIGLLLLGLAGLARAEDKKAEPKRIRDVIYGRKFGMALTMDVFQPVKPNGAGVIYVVSGGWFSSAAAISPLMTAGLADRGYTVFAVVHGSQPKFTIPEIAEDLHRAVRFIRSNAADYQVDGNRLGIMGVSAGGHLSLLMGTAGGPGDPKAVDAVDRESSKVQAVACFCPPTDFLNYGGKEMINRSFQPPYTAATDYHEFNAKKALYVPITDEKTLREISRKVSPISHVSATSAPTLIFHGDKDSLVPLQQSESMVAKLKEAGVNAKLVVREGADHVWPTMVFDFIQCADWFDKYLAKGKDEK
jgi:acetyl esterase/lipase